MNHGRRTRHFNTSTILTRTMTRRQICGSAMSWSCIFPPAVRKLIFQHFSTFPWHRHIPSRSKMFEGQGRLKEPCRYASQAETEFTICRQWCPPPAHPVQRWLAHLLQLPLARVDHQVHLDLTVISLHQVPSLP